MSSVFVFYRKIFQYLSSDRPAGNKKAPGETEKTTVSSRARILARFHLDFSLRLPEENLSSATLFSDADSRRRLRGRSLVRSARGSGTVFAFFLCRDLSALPPCGRIPSL